MENEEIDYSEIMERVAKGQISPQEATKLLKTKPKNESKKKRGPRGLGRVFQKDGGRIWWIQYSFRGQRYRESSRSTQKGDAINLLRTRHQELGMGKRPCVNVEKITLMELIDDVENDKKIKHQSTERFETAKKTIKKVF